MERIAFLSDNTSFRCIRVCLPSIYCFIQSPISAVIQGLFSQQHLVNLALGSLLLLNVLPMAPLPPTQTKNNSNNNKAAATTSNNNAIPSKGQQRGFLDYPLFGIISILNLLRYWRAESRIPCMWSDFSAKEPWNSLALWAVSMNEIN